MKTPNTHVDGIATLLCDASDCAKGARGQHYFVIVDERILVHLAKYVTSGYVVANLVRLWAKNQRSI